MYFLFFEKLWFVFTYRINKFLANKLVLFGSVITEWETISYTENLKMIQNSIIIIHVNADVSDHQVPWIIESILPCHCHSGMER